MKKITPFIIAAALFAQPTLAQEQASSPCDNYIRDEGFTLNLFHPMNGKLPFVAAKIIAEVQAAKKQMCFTFEGSPLFSTTVSPNKICLNMADESVDAPKVAVQMPSGASIDVSDMYSVKNVRPIYEGIQNQCRQILDHHLNPAIRPKGQEI